MADTYTLIDGKPTIKKDPNAVLDYSVDLTAWLALIPGDAVASKVITVSGGLTKGAESFTGNSVSVFVSGGVLGATEWINFRYTTTNGRTDERTVFLLIADR